MQSFREDEYKYVLTYASDVYEALSRLSTLEPLKTNSVQDFQYWLRSIYLATVDGPLSGDINRVVFGRLPHDASDIIIAAICRYRDIPFYAAYPLPFSPRYILLDRPKERLCWDFALAIPFLDGEVLKPYSLSSCEMYINTYLGQLFDGGKYCYMQPRVIQMQSLMSVLKSCRYLPSISLLRRLSWNSCIWLKQKRFKRKLKKYTEKSLSRDKSRPYVYFPLHLQPEMTTSAMGRSVHSDQHLLLARVASVALKHNIDILVKENPIQSFSHRGDSFFDILKSLSNVYLVPQEAPSVDLILSACSVITVSGTAGFEACVYGVPAFCFGTSWWQSFPGVSRSIEQFEQFLENIHMGALPDQSPTLSKVPKDFLTSISATAWPGCQDNFYLGQFSLQFSDNVAQLLASAQGLIHFLE